MIANFKIKKSIKKLVTNSWLNHFLHLDVEKHTIIEAKLPLKLSRDAIIYRLRKYGFSEVATVIYFLDSICDLIPDNASYRFVRDKVQECLDMHDNGGDYFNDMRILIKEIDYLLLFEKQKL